MSKSAVATVVAVALSLSLVNARADAQTGSSTTKSAGKTATTSSTTTTSSPAAAPAAPAAPVTQNYSWTSTGKPVPQTPAKQTGAAAPAASGQPAAAGQATTATTTTATTRTGKKAKADDTIVFFTPSQPNIGVAKGWSKFYNYISLSPGQEQMPFMLTMSNGGPGHGAFEQLKIFLSGQQLATEKDFKGSQLQLKMDGTLNAGNNQIIIQGYSPVAGAQISWKLTTKQPVITTVKPLTGPPGETLTISGRNFATNVAITQVSIGGQAATVVSSAGKTITVQMPSGLPPGDNNVVVAVGGVQSKPFKSVSSKAAPQVSSCDFVSSAPGQAITISGKGFSTKSSDNEVTIGGVVAPINSVSATSISVTIPEGVPYPSWNNAIVVKTSGVESKGDVKINVQQRVIPNDGVPEQ